MRALFTCLAVCLAAPVMADGFCEAVLGLDGQGADPVLRLPSGGEDVRCTRSLALGGGSQLHCGWAFDYRVAAATDAFEQGISVLNACFDQSTPDQNVNHPDFYDLRLFVAGDQEIGLSLKDKAVLGQTYVFLRITR